MSVQGAGAVGGARRDEAQLLCRYLQGPPGKVWSELPHISLWGKQVSWRSREIRL